MLLGVAAILVKLRVKQLLPRSNANATGRFRAQALRPLQRGNCCHELHGTVRGWDGHARRSIARAEANTHTAADEHTKRSTATSQSNGAAGRDPTERHEHRTAEPH